MAGIIPYIGKKVKRKSSENQEKVLEIEKAGSGSGAQSILQARHRHTANPASAAAVNVAPARNVAAGP
jgi:hypothetical protein